jgi:uncharacterized cupredoxin-like copper-binding protein
MRLWMYGAAALALALSASPMATAQDAQVLTVTLTNFKFEPNELHFQRNTPYTLHLVNAASGGHAFSSPEFFAAVSVAPKDAGKIAEGKIEVPAGQTVDIEITPMRAGSYRVTCTHFLHAGFGMRGTAVIE